MNRFLIMCAIIIATYSCSDGDEGNSLWLLPTETDITNKENYFYNEYGEIVPLETFDKYKFIVVPSETHNKLSQIERTNYINFWQIIFSYNLSNMDIDEVSTKNQDIDYTLPLAQGIISPDSMYLCKTIYYQGPVYKNPNIEGGAIVFTNDIYVYLKNRNDVGILYEVAEYFHAEVYKYIEIDGSIIYVLNYNNGFHDLSAVSVANYIHETGLFKRAVALKYIHAMTY
ncbi:MAG: hypothetical protein J6K74_00015 [Marinifilaceae bacterium]|nr:hypothetical protein [Marinifilaceae bacterium]